MQEFIIRFFENLGTWAILISIMLNIAISLLGVAPSIFITAANILVFDLPIGITISIIGEALGAIISFSLYRAGIQKFTKKHQSKYALLHKLENAQGWQAFWLIISLRILPFVPSGGVTFISAMSKVKLITFAIASTLGKIPALFIEAFSVYGVLAIQFEINVILACLGIGILCVLFITYKRRERKRN